MGDVNFNFSSVYAKHLEGVDTDNLSNLPNLNDSGRVHSLNEAMALSENLKNIAMAYANADNKEA